MVFARDRCRLFGMNDLEVAAGLPQTPGYRYADVVGDRLHVAGQVPHDASGTLVSGDVAGQTVQCVANLVTLIELHGFDRADIRHLTIYVVGPQQHLRDAWTALAGTFATAVPPATLLGVHLLGYERQLVEIDARVERAT